MSFATCGHVGDKSALWVTRSLEDLPQSRPITLVLKRYLHGKNLLSSYTGGVSSYGLFLMVVAFLRSGGGAAGDLGSKLTGFLEFFGR